MFDFETKFDVTGQAGPARTQEEADADQAAGLAMIDQKRARLAELQMQLEAEGMSPERARTKAAMAYAAEQG